VPQGLGKKLAVICAGSDTVIIDCVTVYLANLLLKRYPAARIEEEIRTVIKTIRSTPAACIVVSNEVGWGIVPANSLGRKFRDLAGGVNKSLAAAADRVYLTVSGIPIKVK
jgi:adenosylcobinamide kinase/adenosylcobinamide-phosphate guanylyltransferase